MRAEFATDFKTDFKTDFETNLQKDLITNLMTNIEADFADLAILEFLILIDWLVCVTRAVD